MMSHMRGTGSGAVCLRSKSHPTSDHLKILGVSSARSVSNEEFCAAHLAYLSQAAYSEYQRDTEKGLMLYVHAFVHSFIHSFIHSFVYSFIRLLFIHSFIHLYMHALTHAFME